MLPQTLNPMRSVNAWRFGPAPNQSLRSAVHGNLLPSTISLIRLSKMIPIFFHIRELRKKDWFGASAAYGEDCKPSWLGTHCARDTLSCSLSGLLLRKLNIKPPHFAYVFKEDSPIITTYPKFLNS